MKLNYCAKFIYLIYYLKIGSCGARVVGSYPTRGNKLLLINILNSSLSSASQYAIPPEFGGKWKTECPKTRFPMPTLLYIVGIQREAEKK